MKREGEGNTWKPLTIAFAIEAYQKGPGRISHE